MSGDVEPYRASSPAEQINRALRGRDLPARSGGPGFTRPDFVIAGARMPDGRVRLIASEEIRAAELVVDYDFAQVEYDPVVITPVLTGYRTTLTARFGRWVLIEADSYPEALAELARTSRK